MLRLYLREIAAVVAVVAIIALVGSAFWLMYIPPVGQPAAIEAEIVRLRSHFSRAVLQHSVTAWVRLPNGRIQTVSWAPTGTDCRKGDVVHLEQFKNGRLRVSRRGCAAG